MRRARRVDSNQPQIVQTLRDCGCVVEVTSDVGRGFPDAVVLTPRGFVALAEIKDGAKVASKRKLTPDEMSFAMRWGVHYVILTSVDDAIQLAKG